VPPLIEFSSIPSRLKFIPIHDLGVEANQRHVGVNTTFVELLDVIVGVANKRGTVDSSKKISGDEIEDALGQMQGLVVAKVQQLGTIEVQESTIMEVHEVIVLEIQVFITSEVQKKQAMEPFLCRAQFLLSQKKL
jgi:hypothetical protein